MADAAIALIYVDTSDVREGALSELEDAIADLARFVEDNEPDLIAYNVYFSEPSPQARAQLNAKASTLGSAGVTVMPVDLDGRRR